ncbi:MAG: class I SAM-dependent methyltransferase [Planctomycetota bacterium]|jgi:ubiquinone/menaquinone biosynthesis C-methylase UbiE
MAKRKKKKRTASNSDPYQLYELSVQEPSADCDFVDQAWKEVRGREPRTMREDFCATAITAIEWVKRDATHTAIGVDFDPAVLGVAKKRVTKRLKPAQRDRIRLIEDDVLKVETEQVDCVLATNFSYYIFKDRRRMKRYFKRVLGALVDDGLMVLDAYGGSDSFLVMKEPREVDGFTYVWDQKHYNPVNGDVINHIHFRFPDGSRLKSAFVYEWRLWTIPEIVEMLREAGFKDVTVYWEGTGDDGEGNGEWGVTKVGEACAGWVAYLVAAK